MKWLEKFKQVIKDKGIRIEDVAKNGGMSQTGFRDALRQGSLRFDVMIKILDFYNIDYYELISEEEFRVSEDKPVYEISYKNQKDFNVYIDLLKSSYENQLSQSKETIKILNNQLCFMQKVAEQSMHLGENNTKAG